MPVGSTRNFRPPEAKEGEVPAVPSALPTREEKRIFPELARGTF
jgi:hypothetical protein